MKKVFWGFFFLALAVLLLLNCLGVNLGLIGALPVIDLILSVLLLGVAVNAAVGRDWFFVPFPLAVIYMILQDDVIAWIGYGRHVSGWLILLCALLLGIGLSILLSPFGKPAEKITGAAGKGETSRFVSETRYVDCSSFETYTYRVNMGAGDVYFGHPESYKGGGTLFLECHMGAITVHVPAEWHLDADIRTSMGETQVPRNDAVGGPTLTVRGSNRMGSIVFRYC